MCKIEGLKWCVVKSHKPISKNLASKLNKIRLGSVQNNSFSFYYFDNSDKQKIVELLQSYKKIGFEICQFYDKQFGLTINIWGYNPSKLIEISNNMPLKFRFNWHNHGDNLQTVTPITTKQFSQIIRINCA